MRSLLQQVPRKLTSHTGLCHTLLRLLLAKDQLATNAQLQPGGSSSSQAVAAAACAMCVLRSPELAAAAADVWARAPPGCADGAHKGRCFLLC
jgi:hypothetical protein